MNTQTKNVLFVIALALILAGCGGGGGGSGGSTPVPTQPEPPKPPSPVLTMTKLESNMQRGDNFSLSWYANPQVDLPSDGTDGLKVEKPNTGIPVLPEFTFSPTLNDRLEPTWRFNQNAQTRLDVARGLLWTFTNIAATQWSRHINTNNNEDIIRVRVNVGGSCGIGAIGAIACARHGLGEVTLTEDWIVRNYRLLLSGNEEAIYDAVSEVFFVITHEAGHIAGYQNPRGASHGCGGVEKCHAPIGSGSVMSYDFRPPSEGGVSGSVNYGVTQEDIRHVPNATWNEGSHLYNVYYEGGPESLGSWGVTIEHAFEVTGQTDPGRLSGGNLDITDRIISRGYVNGIPTTVLPTGSATYSGKDNFLGVDMHEDYLGALLKADANLQYFFAAREMSLRVNDFEAHYVQGSGPARWHDHNFADFGDFSYDLTCTSNGCSSATVETNWYASDAGDPTGWVAGVLSDEANSYVGAFAAEKD